MDNQNERLRSVDETEAWKFTENLVKAIKRFRESGHAHGDIQPKFFSRGNGTLKLYDPCFINPENGGPKRMAKDPRYTSPVSPQALAALKGKSKLGYDRFKNDVWNMGNSDD